MKKSLVKTGARGARHGAKVAAMTADIPAATLITLGYRIPMLLAGAVNSKARRNPELKRMVAEKAKAAAKSGQALGQGNAAVAAALARYAERQGRTSAEIAAALISADPARALKRLMAHGSVSADLLADLGVRLGAISARTTERSLAPAHIRVTANAKRLAAKARARRS